MDLEKLVIALLALLVGLLGGGALTSWWESQRLAADTAEVKVRHSDQLREAQAKIKSLTDELDTERERSEALEGVLRAKRR